MYMIKNVLRDRRQRLDVLRQRAAEDLLDGQAVVAQLQKARLLHVVEDVRILEVRLADHKSLLSAAAENCRILQMLLSHFLCH